MCGLKLKWVSFKQHTVGSFFKIHSATVCLLIVEFRPFTFKQIIDKCGNAIAILLVAFWLFWSSSSLCPLPLCFDDILQWYAWFPSVCRYPLYICYRLLLCGYHEVYIKHLMVITVSYVQKHTKVLHFYTPPTFYDLVPQCTSFFIMCLLKIL